MKMGIIGFGGMGRWHQWLIESIDELEIAGVWDIDQTAREKAIERGLKVYQSQEELLEQEEIEFVLIATPNDVHCSIAVAAMRAGKHVVCEKPVAMSSQELAEMWNVSKETGRFFTVHQNRRWDEDFLTVKKILDEQILGNVYRIESRVHGSRGIPGDWRAQKQYGGGMVLDWGVHLLDQIMMLKENTPLKSVYSWITNVTNEDVDDGFTTMLTFADGLQVLVEVGTSNFTNLPRWYVLGDNGTAILNDFKPRGEIVRAQGMNETDIVPVQTAAGLTKTMAPRRDDTIFHEELPKVESDVRDFYRNVIDVIENGAEPLVKLPQVMRVMKLMELVFESARTGEVMKYE